MYRIKTIVFAVTVVCVTIAMIGCSEAPDQKTTVAGNFDLVALEVEHEPKRIKVGDKVRFNWSYTNLGEETIPKKSFGWVLYVEQDKVHFRADGPRMLPEKFVEGGMKGEDFSWRPKVPGTYRYWFVVDEGNRVEESNELNNVITGEIVVEE